MLVFSKEHGCVPLENAFPQDKGVDLTPEKNYFLKEHELLFVFPRNTTMFLREHKHFFGNMIVLVLRKKHFLSKHNHFLGNMVTLSWSTWFMVSL
jgi:hypothetical protein